MLKTFNIECPARGSFMPRGVAVLVAGFGLFGGIGKTTTLVGIWSADSFVIAADSKANLTRDGKLLGSANFCKILPLKDDPDTVIAFSGLLSAEQQDIVSAVRAAPVATAKSIDFREAMIIRSATQALEAVIKARVARGSINPEAEVNAGLIVGMQFQGKRLLRSVRLEGVSQAWIAEVERKGFRAGTFSLALISFPEMLDGYSIFGRGTIVLGQFAAIKAAIASNTFLFPVNESAIDRARRMINIEIKAMPETVGAPISIMVIDAKGPRWVERGACKWEPQAVK